MPALRTATQPTIGVWHPADTTNQGDRAINRAVVDNLREAFPDSRIVLFAKDLAVGRRLFPDEQVSLVRYGGPSFAEPQRLRELDLLLCGGGSLLQQSSWLYVPQQLRPAFLASRCGVPTALYCSGVEPIRSLWLRKLVAKACRDVFDALIVRGPRSQENLRRCGVTKDIIVAVDPAVALRPAPEEQARAYLREKLGLDPTRTCISLCPKVVSAYGGILPVSVRKRINVRRRAIQRRADRAFAALVDYLVERRAAQVALIPMFHGQGDLAVCRNVYQLCNRKDRVAVVDELLDSSRLLKGLFGVMTMHLGVRLHSVILATSAGVPAGLVAYMHKGHEYMELAAMREYILEEREISFDALKSLADRVWDDRPQLRPHLHAQQAALAKRYAETNEVVRAMLKRGRLRCEQRTANVES